MAFTGVSQSLALILDRYWGKSCIALQNLIQVSAQKSV